MGMYCACGVKKSHEWKCECDWKGWNLCFKMDHNDGHFPDNLPVKECPDIDGIYEVRTFDDDYDESESEFSTIKKNWGESTNQIVSNWKVEYSDGWTGYRGVYAWKEKDPITSNSRKCIKCGKLHDTVIEDTTTMERLKELEKCYDCLMSECTFDWRTDQIELYGVDESMDVKDVIQKMKQLEQKVIDAMELNSRYQRNVGL